MNVYWQTFSETQWLEFTECQWLGFEEGLPQGFRLYDHLTGDFLYTLPGSSFSLDPDLLGLTEGWHTFDLTYVDDYGTEGEAAMASFLFTDGQLIQRLPPLTQLEAQAIAGGYVDLSWWATNSGNIYQTPAEFEIFDSEDLVTPIEIVTVSHSSAYQQRIGPFDHGLTKIFKIRASDGEVSGLRGSLATFSPILIDAEAPPPPTRLDTDTC